MRKLLLFLLINSLVATAQNFNLASISQGDYITFRAVFDQNQKLYGYFSLYDIGKVNATEKEFEFIILDKNLNKVLTNKVTILNEISYLLPYINVDGDLILSPQPGYGVTKDFILPKSKKLNLKTNEIEDYNFYCFEDNQFVDCPENKSYRERRAEFKKNKKDKEYVDESDVWRLKNNNFLVLTSKNYFKYTKDNELRFFDQNKQELWSFKYNLDGSKKDAESLNIMHYNEDKLYVILRDRNKDDVTNYIIIFETKTGKIITKEKVSDFDKFTLNAYDNNTSMYHSNENYVFLFNYLYSKDGVLGYITTKIDKKTNEITHKKLYFEKDLNRYLPKINRFGYVENGYLLNLKDVFFMEDGSVKLLTEKFKPAGQYNRMKTTDMVFISTNSNFEVELVKTLEKEKSKNEYTDYMFSQEINDKKDIVFFYKDFQKDDETKDKNWILFINTLIKGSFNQEQITISSKNDKFISIPYVAKEGYILLREYNEKEKYNEIRLERLNY